MNQITKKEFKRIHANGLLRLLATSTKESLDGIKQALDANIKNNFDFDAIAIKTSRIDVENQGKHLIITCYHYKQFIIVNKVYYAEFDNNVSWNDTKKTNVIYLNKR